MKTNLTSKLLLVTFITFWLNQSTAQCYYSQPTSFWAKGKSTGIIELDNALNNENILLNAVFGVNIDLFVGGDQVNAENAMFAPICNHQNCQGEIWLGLNLMSSLFKKEHGLERLKAVFAHEYAHALQSKWGFSGYGKFPELHADFLAGYYIGIKGSVSEEMLTSFVDQFYSIGDNDFFSKDHHGTGTERGCAFIEGYKVATVNHLNTYQAYLAGIDYVRINTPCVSFKIQKQYEAAPVNVVNVEKGEIIITSDKKSLRLINNLGQIFGYSSPLSPFKAVDIPVGTYNIRPVFDGFMGPYSLPTIPIEVKPYSRVIVNITKVKNFWSIQCNVNYQYVDLPKPIDFYADGYKEFKNQNYVSAIEKMNKEIVKNPSNHNAYFIRAICKSENGDRNGAIADYKFILNNNNEIHNPIFLLGTIYNNIGYSYLELGEYENAQKYISSALELSPYEYYIWGSSGELNFKTGKYEQCVKDYTKSIELMESKISLASSLENNGTSYYYRGLAYLKLKKNNLACIDFKKALELGYTKANEELNKSCNK